MTNMETLMFDMKSCHQTAECCTIYLLFCLEMFSFAAVFQGHFLPACAGSVVKRGADLPGAPEQSSVLVLVAAGLDTGFLVSVFSFFHCLL